MQQQQEQVGVLFVCMGNICRSPTAEGVFQKLVAEAGLGERIRIDSAGTHAYHIGEPPDPRSQQTAQRRGIQLGHLRARQVEAGDFLRFDYLLAMDQGNYQILSQARQHVFEEAGRLSLMMDFAPHLGISEVPDPYYGGGSGFDAVFDMLEEASAGLLAEIRSTRGF